jgi:hypothetical protein
MAKTHAVLPGYCVAVHLMPETAPENCYIGVVDVVDEHGILINLVHWDDKLDMLGGYTESIFVPWMNINSMLISTENQPTRRFMADRARKWKYRIEAMHDKEETVVKKRTSGR